jgi:hypothetical protein
MKKGWLQSDFNASIKASVTYEYYLLDIIYLSSLFQRGGETLILIDFCDFNFHN